MENKNNSSYTIFCERCGRELDSKSRYCMKCGNLNPNHPDNKNMTKYISNKQESYSVGSGNIIVNTRSDNTTVTCIGNNTGNFNVCFITNMILYLFIVVFSCAITYINLDNNISLVLYSNIYIVLILSSIVFLFVFAMELIFMKMNNKWWGALIPIYNNMVISRCVFGSVWPGVFTLVPIIGQIIYLVMIYKLAGLFKKSGILMVLFPLVMILIIAYGGSPFKNILYVSNENSLDYEYKRKKMFLKICMFFLAAGILIYAYANINTIKSTGSSKASAVYLYSVSKTVGKGIKKVYAKGKYTCTGDDNIKYFYFNEVDADFFMPFAVFHEPVSVYVKIVPNGESEDYYLSMTDGKYGFNETLLENISLDTVVEYNTLNDVSQNNLCSL